MTIEELAEEVGLMADTAENLVHASQLPMTPETHKERLVDGIRRLRDRMRSLRIQVTGNNPWEDYESR
jgi:hypothetical protein